MELDLRQSQIFTLKRESQAQETAGRAEGRLSRIRLCAEEVGLPYGLTLAGAPSQAQEKAEASERKMPILLSV